MSQASYNNLIDPAVSKGPDLNSALDAQELAINSNHSGASRPSYLPAGGDWLKIVSSTQHELYSFDGTDDILIFTLNPVDNSVVFANTATITGATGAVRVPVGTTAERPAGAVGLWRENATTGQPERYNGTGWESFPGATALSVNNLMHVQDQKTVGAAGGTFTSGDWRTRELNTVLTNNISGSSLSSNQITLPIGTYFIESTHPAFKVSRNKTRLRNITDSTTDLIGSSEDTSDTVFVCIDATLSGLITIAAEKVFEFQHQCGTTQASNGFGAAANFSDPELYSEVKIWKVS
jgi:hypothetical protein